MPVRLLISTIAGKGRKVKGVIRGDLSPCAFCLPPERVLISTIVPISGGVPQMASFVAGTLASEGYEPVVAYYQPYSLSPELSVPGHRLFRRRVGTRPERALGAFEAHAMGAWLPELEFTHYLPTRSWRRLFESCQHYVAVSGNCLAATGYALTDRPFLAWVATPWHDDRRDRIRLFPWYRRVLDRLLNGRVLGALERRVLRRGTILALSRYTGEGLNRVAARRVTFDVLPMPVDIDRFSPDPAQVMPGRVSFVGRVDDPRKNVGLLIEAVKCCRDAGLQVTAHLIGGAPPESVRAQVQTLALGDAVRFHPYLGAREIAEHLRRTDVFVIPSHQEGLCIAALEAMACGCPVVSTRSGGPEEFVLEGRTGLLCDFAAPSMAQAVRRIVGDRAFRATLSVGARRLVEESYGRRAARERFWAAFRYTFGRQGASGCHPS